MSSLFSIIAPRYVASDVSATLPPWSPLVFGVILLVTLVVAIVQARRYFRDNPRDENPSDGKRDSGRGPDESP